MSDIKSEEQTVNEIRDAMPLREGETAHVKVTDRYEEYGRPAITVLKEVKDSTGAVVSSGTESRVVTHHGGDSNYF